MRTPLNEVYIKLPTLSMIELDSDFEVLTVYIHMGGKITSKVVDTWRKATKKMKWALEFTIIQR